MFGKYLINPEEVVLKSMLTIFWTKTLDIVLISTDQNPISAEFFKPYEKVANPNKELDLRSTSQQYLYLIFDRA